MKQNLHCFLLVFLLIFCSGTIGNTQTTNQYTHWVLAHVISDYEYGPVNERFVTGGPVIEHLDSSGAVLLFYLTPQSNRDCRQVFRVGWQFSKPVADLEEGETIGTDIFAYPVTDTTPGLLDCFEAASEVPTDPDGLTIRFLGGDSAGLTSKPELSFYWNHGATARFYLKNELAANCPFQVSHPDPIRTTGTFVVQDLAKGITEPEIPFGTFAFEIIKRELFTFRVLYLFDGTESDVSPAGAHRLLVDKVVVDHTVNAGNAEPVMNIRVMGLLEEAVGRDLQITIRFLDTYRRPLPGIEGDTAFCDRGGYVVAYSPPIRIPDRQFYLDGVKITIPYYALNLPFTQSGHLINLYAEVFLDGKGIGVSKLVQTNFYW